ncbi:hypothetical protein ACTA71_007582 [Dictyostelium dimigraforme]
MINQFMDAVENNNINSPNGTKEINHTDPTIPKTEFQKDLKLKGYNNNLFRNVPEIKGPKTRNTMFRFHSRCLPLNYLYDKQCMMCNDNMSNDPYGHLFFNCIKTKEFIKIHKLKRFLFDSNGSNKNCQEKEDISTLDYEVILKKWHKSARPEFIKKIKTFKLDNSKQPHLINTPNTINNITIIRNEIIKHYCIPKSILPKRVIIDKFI